MGMLRLLLAFSVLLQHAHGIGGYEMLGGPLAVQCFYIVSGFYMGLVLNERYDRAELNRTFWINRAIRIYSIYFLFLALYLLVFALAQATSGTSPLNPYLTDTVSPWEKMALALLNLTVIGQDLTFWLKIDQGHLAWTMQAFGHGGIEVFKFMVLPLAWSLSLELMFYAIAPFIARRSVAVIAGIAALSLIARIVAGLMGLVDDPLSYRFFPFELALFLGGVLSYRMWAARRGWWGQGANRWLALALALAIIAYPAVQGDWSGNLFFTPPRIALLLLFCVALPAIHGISRNWARDRAIGELSYPFYLGHLLVLGLLGGLPALKGNDDARTLVAAAVTLALSWLVVRFVDERVEAWRRRIAQRAGAV